MNPLLVLTLGTLLAGAPTFALSPEAFSERLDSAARLYRAGDYAGAEVAARALRTEAALAFGESSVETAEALDLLVEAAYWNGKRRDEESSSDARTAVDLRRQLHLAPSLEVARSLHMLGLYLANNDEEDGARAAFVEALTLRRAAAGEASWQVADSLSELGYLRFEAHIGPVVWTPLSPPPPPCREGLPEHQAEGLRLTTEAAALAEADAGCDPARLADLLNNLATLQGRAGCLPEALASHERCRDLRMAHLGPDHPQVGRSVHNVAIALWRLGRFAEAVVESERALEMRRSALGPDHPHVASSHSALAYFLHVGGDLVRAEQHYREAVEGLRRGYGEGHFRHATALHNLGLFLQELGQYEEALELFDQAATIRRRSNNENLGESLAARGLLYLEMGDPEAARRSLLEALTADEKRSGRNHPKLARTLVGLGRLAWQAGAVDAARANYQRALRLTEDLAPDHPDLLAPLAGLAEVAERQGDYDTAQELLNRGLAILGDAFPAAGLGVDHPEKGRLLGQRARVAARAGRRQDALRDALLAQEVLRRHVQATARYLPERLALGYAGSLEESRDLVLDLVAKSPEPGSQAELISAWDAVIRSRALVFDVMLTRYQGLRREDDPLHLALAEDLADARHALAGALVRLGSRLVEPKDALQVLRQRRQEVERAERALALAGEKATLSNAEGLGLKEVRRHLPAGSALVSLVRYQPLGLAGRTSAPSRYLAFLQTGGGGVRLVDLGVAGRVDAAVDRVRETAREALENPQAAEERYLRVGDQLRQLVWDRFAPGLQGARQIFVVPDGSVHLVNLAALPAAGGGYLIESAPPIHRLTAERNVVRSGQEPPTTGLSTGLLALGDVDFNAFPQMAGLEGIPAGDLAPAPVQTARLRSACLGNRLFGPLPGTRLEVEAVARLWQEVASGDHLATPAGSTTHVRTLVGREASEAGFKALAERYGVLHLATHGVFSGLRCAPGSKAGWQEGGLAGLVLSGANRRDRAAADEEDGILTAEEIVGLDLSGVSWAVLSACDSGIGRLAPGEGVFGLQRAFQLAGVQTVIMSLWPVPDHATVEWMGALYASRLSQRRSTLDSVRQASLTVLAARRQRGQATHPFYWGSFVAAGEWK